MDRQWEYRFEIETTWDPARRVHVGLDDAMGRLMERANEAGAAGWEMVSYTLNPYGSAGYFVTIVMKRPRSDIWR